MKPPLDQKPEYPNTKKMKAKLTLTGLLALTLLSCVPDPPADQNVFVHTVFFWLKPGLTPEDKAAFEKGLENLGKASTIKSYEYGVPAGTSRDVVDNSYDYAWIVRFDNAEDQELYQTDPIHLEFIDKFSHLWSRVLVYDTLIK